MLNSLLFTALITAHMYMIIWLMYTLNHMDGDQPVKEVS
jgi:hypothetical protein